MVDGLIKEHGGTLLAKATRKLQWEAAVEMKAHQKLLGDFPVPSAGNGALPDQTTLIRAPSLPGVTSSFKHPVYPFGGLNHL